ncbi:MAG: (2Fe-2S)-binding protein [Comamonas sp.]
MIICICNRVSDREITRCARSGMDFEDIQLELGVATQCGQCEDSARGIHARCRTEHTIAFISNSAASQPARHVEEDLPWNSLLPLAAA